ncbi:MAG: TIGR02186 family protein [Acidobacteria bacterium]|nr:TIGR02186 family protein [Acidobacteriota bacterium]
MSDPGAGRTAPLVLVALLLCSAPATTAEAPASADPAPLAVSPTHIPVTSSFHGATLSIDVSVPSGSEVALKVEGARGRVIFNRKGRVFFLWMNVGEVTVGNAPQVYMLSTSTDLVDLASGETLRRLGLGRHALESQIATRGEGIDRETMLDEFFDYKERGELYGLSQGTLRPDRSDPGGSGSAREHYSVDVALPSSIPVGAYEVGLYAFTKGQLVERATETVTIEKIGFARFVSRLARQHPGEYGLLAIVVAVAAGFSIGLVFSHVGRRPGS